MLHRILSVLTGPPEAEHDPDALRLAVAAILVEAARMDDRFGTEERETIRRLLAGRFELGPWEIDRLIGRAEAAAGGSAGLFRFTHEIVRRYGAAERIGLIEMLWEVAYADGTLDPEEDMLIRRIAGLIHVEDQDRGAARHRVLERRRGPG